MKTSDSIYQNKILVSYLQTTAKVFAKGHLKPPSTAGSLEKEFPEITPQIPLQNRSANCLRAQQFPMPVSTLDSSKKESLIPKKLTSNSASHIVISVYIYIHTLNGLKDIFFLFYLT